MHKKYLFLIGVLIALVSGSVCFYVLQTVMPRDRDLAETTAPPGGSATQEKSGQEEELACVAAMPLETRIGQKLMAAGYAAWLQRDTAAFSSVTIGGIIIMDEVPAESITALRQAMTIPPIIAVDQEGGSVQRYKSAGYLPGAAEMASQSSVDTAYQYYLKDSQRLKKYGITTNFAPVVDVMSRTPSPLPGRMYSSDPAIVADYAAANIKAAKAAGITPVIKHFPGLGSASGNTDLTSATTDSLAALESRDLVLYRQLAALRPDVMVGNMIVPGLTDGQPAIWSHKATTLLRDIGYQDAVVYSDSLTAEAVPGNMREAVLKAWLAGIDVALIVQDSHDIPDLAGYLQDIIGYASAAVRSGELGSETLDQSVLRILHRKQINPCQL